MKLEFLIGTQQISSQAAEICYTFLPCRNRIRPRCPLNVIIRCGEPSERLVINGVRNTACIVHCDSFAAAAAVRSFTASAVQCSGAVVTRHNPNNNTSKRGRNQSQPLGCIARFRNLTHTCGHSCEFRCTVLCAPCSCFAHYR